MVVIKRRKRVLFLVVIMILCLSVPLPIYADSTVNYTSEDVFVNDDLLEELSESPIIELRGIGTPRVKAVRTSSIRLDYSYSVTLSPKADKATIKIWKCVYSSSEGKWVSSGAAKVITQNSVTAVKIGGSFNVTAGKNYRIKAYIIETRDGNSTNKTAWSDIV